MSIEKERILIVEDDLDVADMLSAYFNVQGYDVQTANWGEDALRACQAAMFNLVVLDIRLPDIDGFEVARRLRRNRRTANIPIIFLTEKRARADRLLGFEIGADDYITKPFDVQELRLRVRNALQRAAKGVVINPVTNFPEGEAVESRLQAAFDQPEWAALVVELQNLDHFRDLYGFISSDDVLRAISLMVSNAVRDVGSPNDFVGMYSPTEFLVLTPLAHQAALVERIKTRLEQSLDFFYPLKDRERTDLANRLAIRIRAANSAEGPVKDLAALKKRLAG